ncbi:GntR family transcriptional regulator [Nocardia wallacei]|uniref:GntR family transcriptional regulator n=1 Tax=Nocardia wallacei TaxID=480035 RepID=UPI0024561CB5|nr:GntR family transcriptional regulator [Nocardia wallacei]
MPPPNIWRDIAADLRRRVEEGEWAVGDRIDSMRSLMTQYEVESSTTISRAIQLLANEGVLMTDPHAPRRGVRVRARQRFLRPIDQQLAAPVDHATGRTFEEFSFLAEGDLDLEIAYAHEEPGELAELLGDEPLLRRTYRYLIHGTPHQVVRSWMPDRIAAAAGLRSPDDEVVGRFTESWLVAAGVTPHHVSLTLESRLPTEDEADDLAMPRALPIMVRRRTLYDPDGQAVEMNISRVVADQIMYQADFDLRMPDAETA